MDLRRRQAPVIRKLREYNHERWLHDVVSGAYHIIPEDVIAETIDKLHPESLALLAPYIPESLYDRLPLEYCTWDTLCPLIYTRRGVWRSKTYRRNAPYDVYAAYLDYRAALHVYRRLCDTSLDDDKIHRIPWSLFGNLPKKELDAFVLRLLNTAGINTSVFGDIFGDMVIPAVASPDIVISLMNAAFDHATSCNYAGVAQVVLQKCVLWPPFHYRVADAAIWRYLTDATLFKLCGNSCLFTINRGIRQGKLFCRLSSDTRIRFAHQANKVYPNNKDFSWTLTLKFLSRDEREKVEELRTKDAVADALIEGFDG